MKRILFISTGGTIASRRGADGLTPVMGSAELLKYAPRIKEFAWVETLELFNLDSTNVTPKHWLQIASAIKGNYDRLNVTIPKGRKQAVEAHAKGKGESVNGYVNGLIRGDMGLTEDEWKRGDTE